MPSQDQPGQRGPAVIDPSHLRPPATGLRVIGVDAYPLGWVGVEIDNGAFARAFLAATLYELVVNSSGTAMIGVDVPLGMQPDRWRAVDALIARRLGPRRHSVTRVPPRPVWQEADFTAANKRCRELTGENLRRDTFTQRAKILQANALWQRHPSLLFEGHPELSFRTMAGAPLEQSIATWAGYTRRVALLAHHGIHIPEQLGPAGQVPAGRILDAAAIAWTAHRRACGTAHQHPEPAGDGKPTRIAIWA